jgi:hypothetical protein
VNIILFIMVGLTAAFCIGVLVGSSLHTRGIDRQYQRLARLVRHVNELDAAPDMTQGIKPTQYSSSRFASVR